MSKRAAAPTSYAASLTVEDLSAKPQDDAQQAAQPAEGGQGRVRRPLEEVADPSVLVPASGRQEEPSSLCRRAQLQGPRPVVGGGRGMGGSQGPGWPVARAVGWSSAAP